MGYTFVFLSHGIVYSFLDAEKIGLGILSEKNYISLGRSTKLKGAGQD